MPLDSCMIAALAHEFRTTLTGAKIEKIHQPGKDEVDLFFRAGGRQKRLSLRACPGSPRAHLSELPRENPAVPPSFLILLRKHLGSGILRKIEQPGFERMLIFRFDSRDEMGFETKRALCLEMMGKYGNLLLLGEDDRILGVLRPTDFSADQKRQLLVGMTYELPPSQEGKVDPLAETKEAFMRKAKAAGDRPADKFLLSSFRGVSPLIAREISCLATGETDAPSRENAEKLYASFETVFSNIRNGVFSPCLVRFDAEDARDDYTFMPITQFGGSAKIGFFDSPSEMFDFFFAEKEREEAVKRRAQDLYKAIANAEARLLRKTDAQQRELADCADKEKYKNRGELITANLYAIKKGDESVRLTDYYDPALPTVTLELDKRLSPAQNAQKYFKKYAKLKTAEKELSAQIAQSEEELRYLRSVRDALDRSSLPSDTEEIRAELIKSGYIRLKRREMSKKKSTSPFIRYESGDGFTILCGRNNLQNDELSFRVAGKKDWWFHVHNAAGSHVILLCDGVDDPPAGTFTEAAAIAAANSSLAGSARVTVDYTRAGSLRKPPAARPGFVIYHTNYSTEVDPAIEKRVKREK